MNRYRRQFVEPLTRMLPNTKLLGEKFGIQRTTAKKLLALTSEGLASAELIALWVQKVITIDDWFVQGPTFCAGAISNPNTTVVWLFQGIPCQMKYVAMDTTIIEVYVADPSIGLLTLFIEEQYPMQQSTTLAHIIVLQKTRSTRWGLCRECPNRRDDLSEGTLPPLLVWLEVVAEYSITLYLKIWQWPSKQSDSRPWSDLRSTSLFNFSTARIYRLSNTSTKPKDCQAITTSWKLSMGDCVGFGLEEPGHRA